ncbi:hypothetical protein EVAR_95930_1 [Eumeta japonica]|uniref:Uncharacterized protein n=1 Tax=Eumeta variegata TaxID=151549 RepID=A0A4C1V8J8_EUMVA|nr:hypothetical protein EVAR_95930_1 [Eumeta japonica]
MINILAVNGARRSRPGRRADGAARRCCRRARWAPDLSVILLEKTELTGVHTSARPPDRPFISSHTHHARRPARRSRSSRRAARSRPAGVRYRSGHLSARRPRRYRFKFIISQWAPARPLTRALTPPDNIGPVPLAKSELQIQFKVEITERHLLVTLAEGGMTPFNYCTTSVTEAAQTVRRDALGRRDIIPEASHVDTTESSEPQSTLVSAVRILTNIPRLVLKLVKIFEG